MTSVPVTTPLVHPSAARRSAPDLYLLAVCLILLGYAIDGRGFAYLFFGEMALAAGMVLLIGMRGWGAVFQIPQILLLLPFWAWGIMRTAPFLHEYRVDAVRDAMLWGYSAFAFIIAALIVAEPARLVTLLRRYRTFARWFLIAIPIVAMCYRFFWFALPRWPWAGVPIIEEKEGDVLVHLSGILAFWIAGLETDVKPGWVILLAINVATMGVIDRAGLLAFGVVAFVCALHRPLHHMIWRLLAVFVIAVVLLWATDLHIQVPGGKGRDISFDQLVTNIRSMGSDTGSDGLDSTKEWRMDWWHEIIRYTVRGQYFWTGKGFGVNLADDDGFQVLADDSLRAPHSAHMDFLAREGVPGFLLWIVLQAAWGAGVGGAYLASRRADDERWQAVFLFIFAIWLAFLINSSFDVFLEGPMGGIWFWTIWGAGAAALWIHKNRPETLYRK
jgi:hypothetical protein